MFCVGFGPEISNSNPKVKVIFKLHLFGFGNFAILLLKLLFVLYNKHNVVILSIKNLGKVIIYN